MARVHANANEHAAANEFKKPFLFYILHALDAFAAIYLFSITSLEAQS